MRSFPPSEYPVRCKKVCSRRAGINWFSGMFRTLMNIVVGVLAGMVVAKSCKEFHKDVYNEKSRLRTKRNLYENDAEGAVPIRGNGAFAVHGQAKGRTSFRSD